MEWQNIIRRDISHYLIHWTKSRYEGDFPKSPTEITAFDVLIEILKEKKLIGSDVFIKGRFNCICFTETPLPEMVSIFNYSNKLSEKKVVKYDPFGIGFSKKRIYEKGGRPVIYQSAEEYEILPKSIKWRHNSFNPLCDIDFTWEREWRIKLDELILEPNEIIVVVPNTNFVKKIIENPEIDSGFNNRIFPLTPFGLMYE